MNEFLRNAVSILALAAGLSLIGLGVEWLRRRRLHRWAREQGGTFEAGRFFEGAAVPEAAAFDAPGGDKRTYHNVVRIRVPEAEYVVAQTQLMYRDAKNALESRSHVVCFVTLPAGPELAEDALPPAVRQALSSSDGLIAGLQARGRTVRVQAVGRRTGYPHAEVLAFAKRLAADWRAVDA